jgi:hypothetical protein
MGITYTEGTLTGPSGKQATLRFLVDSKRIGGRGSESCISLAIVV